MKIYMPNGIVGEGTVSECLDFAKISKPEKIKVTVKTPKYGRGVRRRSWTGEELYKVMETINLSMNKVKKMLPARTGASIGNIRWMMKYNRVTATLQKRLDEYISNNR